MLIVCCISIPFFCNALTRFITPKKKRSIPKKSINEAGYFMHFNRFTIGLGNLCWYFLRVDAVGRIFYKISWDIIGFQQ